MHLPRTEHPVRDDLSLFRTFSFLSVILVAVILLSGGIVRAQDATDEATPEPAAETTGEPLPDFMNVTPAAPEQVPTLILSVDIPPDFVATHGTAGTIRLVRPDDLMMINIAVGAAANVQFPETPPTDLQSALDAYNAFGLYIFEPEQRSIQTAGQRSVVTQTFFHPNYGENVMLSLGMFDTERMMLVLAVKADADLDESDRAIVLDVISSVQVDTDAESVVIPASRLGAEMPAGEIQMSDGTLFRYDENYFVFPDALISSLATVWSVDNQTYITVYVNHNPYRLAERTSTEFSIEPYMQQSGQADFDAQTGGEIIFDQDGRTITRYISSEWAPYGQNQVNFYYLVIEGEDHLALFQGLTYDVANLDTHLTAAQAMAESLVFGDIPVFAPAKTAEPMATDEVTVTDEAAVTDTVVTDTAATDEAD